MMSAKDQAAHTKLKLRYVLMSGFQLGLRDGRQTSECKASSCLLELARNKRMLVKQVLVLVAYCRPLNKQLPRSTCRQPGQGVAAEFEDRDLKVRDQLNSCCMHCGLEPL